MSCLPSPGQKFSPLDESPDEHDRRRTATVLAPAAEIISPPALQSERSSRLDHPGNDRQHRQRQRQHHVVIAAQPAIAIFAQRDDAEAEREAQRRAQENQTRAVRADRASGHPRRIEQPELFATLARVPGWPPSSRPRSCSSSD